MTGANLPNRDKITPNCHDVGANQSDRSGVANPARPDTADAAIVQSTQDQPATTPKCHDREIDSEENDRRLLSESPIPDTAAAMRQAAHRVLARLWYGVGAEAQEALVRAQTELDRVRVRPGAPARGYVPRPYREADKDDILWAGHPESAKTPIQGMGRNSRGRGT